MRYRAPHLYVEGHPTLSKGELLVIFAILVLSKNPCFGLLLNSPQKWPTQYQLGQFSDIGKGLIFRREQEHFISNSQFKISDKNITSFFFLHLLFAELTHKQLFKLFLSRWATTGQHWHEKMSVQKVGGKVRKSGWQYFATNMSKSWKFWEFGENMYKIPSTKKLI